MSEINVSLLSSLRAQRNKAQMITDSGDKWPEYGSGVGIYEAFLGLKSGHLRRICDRVSGHQVMGLDLMGDGTVLTELNIGGAAINLIDRRSDELRKKELELGIVLIDGNILASLTWKRLKVLNKKFDLILFRPGAGIRNITDKSAIHAWILQQAWSVLGLGGTLIAQTPIESQPLLEVWASKKHDGLNASCSKQYFSPRLVIKKLDHAPNKLPLKLS
jgi:hypothetical protein